MSRVYPIAAGEAQGSAFYVTTDGVYTPLHIARVSAAPINRRWPGHQRPLDQTELAYFAMFETDSPAQIAVRPAKPFEKVVIKPLSKGIIPTVDGETVRFTVPGAGAYTVELDGYHGALHIFADPPKKYDAGKGNVIYFGKGVHEAGLIELKTGDTLFIDEGALVYGRVHAADADNIRIIGRGILDASRVHEKILFEPGRKELELFEKGFDVKNSERRDTVELRYCDNVLIDGITIRDSLLYTIRPLFCRGLRIENVKIIGNWRYNSDGIDMHNCERVSIRGCFVRTYDDSICIKGCDRTCDGEMLHDGYLHDLFSDVLVEDCVIWCDWGRALEFGAETGAREIRNVTFRSCDVIRTAHVALDVQNVDYADIHDVLFENISVEYDKVSQLPTVQHTDSDVFAEDPHSGYMPKLMCSQIKYHPEYSADKERRGINRDVTFRNIYVTAPRMPRSTFEGFDDEHQSRNVTVDGLYLNGRRIEKTEDARIEIREFVSDFRFV